MKQNRVLKVNPDNYVQQFLTNMQNKLNAEKIIFFNKWCWSNWTSMGVEKSNPELNFHSYKGTNSKVLRLKVI